MEDAAVGGLSRLRREVRDEGGRRIASRTHREIPCRARRIGWSSRSLARQRASRAVDDLDRHLRCAVHDEIAFLDPRRCVDQDIDRLSPTVRGPLDDQVRTRTNARDRVRAIGPSNESLSAVLVDPGEAKCRHRLAPFVAHAAADEDLARSGLGGEASPGLETVDAAGTLAAGCELSIRALGAAARAPASVNGSAAACGLCRARHPSSVIAIRSTAPSVAALRVTAAAPRSRTGSPPRTPAPSRWLSSPDRGARSCTHLGRVRRASALGP